MPSVGVVDSKKSARIPSLVGSSVSSLRIPTSEVNVDPRPFWVFEFSKEHSFRPSLYPDGIC